MTDPKPQRFTSVVRRGLVLVRGLLLDSFDDNKPPSPAIVKGWTRRQQTEFNRAMAWIEQIEERAAEEADAQPVAT